MTNREQHPGFTKGNQRGFALFEALISLLIISLGLLGLAGLHVRLTSLELESYQRSQALVLVRDMAARMENNWKQIATYAISTDDPTSKFIGADGEALPTGCVRTFATVPDSAAQANNIAVCDLNDWAQSLQGDASGGNAILLNPRACIAAVSASQYMITVTWTGVNSTVEPPTSCASTKYSDQTLRRAVSIVVTKPDLDCDSTNPAGAVGCS